MTNQDTGCSELEFLKIKLEEAYIFRANKAVQYPNDGRNADAAESISKLLIEVIEGGYPMAIFARYMRAYETSNELPDQHPMLLELSQYFSRIGFDHFPQSAGDLMVAVSDIMDRHSGSRTPYRSPTADRALKQMGLLRVVQ